MHILGQILRNTVLMKHTGTDRALGKTRTVQVQKPLWATGTPVFPQRDVVEIAVFHSVLPSVSHGLSALPTVMLVRFS